MIMWRRRTKRKLLFLSLLLSDLMRKPVLKQYVWFLLFIFTFRSFVWLKCISFTQPYSPIAYEQTSDTWLKEDAVYATFVVNNLTGQMA